MQAEVKVVGIVDFDERTQVRFIREDRGELGWVWMPDIVVNKDEGTVEKAPACFTNAEAVEAMNEAFLTLYRGEVKRTFQELFA